MMDPVELLNRHCEKPDDSGRIFVNVRLLDTFHGETISMKSRFLKAHLLPILAGTPVIPADVMKTESKQMFVQLGYIQLIIMHGSRDLPWTDARKTYVRHFFGEHVIPP